VGCCWSKWETMRTGEGEHYRKLEHVQNQLQEEKQTSDVEFMSATGRKEHP